MADWKCRSLRGVVLVLAAALAGPVFAADDWLNLATVSMTDATTPKLAHRYVCYTDGSDIACNSPSLYVTTGGLVGISTTAPGDRLEVAGNVYADAFKPTR